MLQSIGWLYTL